MIGHDEHAFLAQAQPLAFHGSRHHFKRLARAHLMGKQRVAAVQHMGDSVPLVLPQRNLRVHAGENNMAAVVFARTNGIEQLIVLRHQRLPPLRVFPYPFTESVLDGLLLLLCKGGRLLIEHALLPAVRILHSIVDAHIPQVQRVLQNLVGVGSVRAVGGIRGDIGAGHDILAVDAPLGGMGREVYLDGTALVIRGIEQLVHEVLNVLRRDPRRAQPHVNVGRLQILGLCGFQRRHIGLKGSVRLHSGSGLAQLLPHIAGQVFICRHILRLGAGDSEDDACQLLNDVLRAFPGQLGHIAEIHSGSFPDGHRQRVGRGVHMIDAALLLDRPLRKHIRFPQQLVIIIEDFERAEQVVGGIRRKRKAVGSVIDKAVPRGEAVIQSIQLLLKLLNFPVAVLIELRVDQLTHLIPQGNHTLDALLRRLIQVGLYHAAVFTIIDCTVQDRIRKVAHIGIGGNGLVNRFIVAQIGQRRLLIGAVDMANRLMQLIREAHAFFRENGEALPAVLRILPGQRAQNHLRVLNKVAVHGQAVCIFTHMHPIRFNLDGPIPLLQEDDVRNDLGARVGAKGVVGQPDRAQQLCTLCDVSAHLRGLLIHRVAGGDKGNHSARTHLVDGLGEEVVVNGKTELVVSPVVDLIVAKGHVADGEVEEVTPVRRFKARDGDVGLGIKLLRDAPGDAVQLHTVQAAGLHSFRQHSEEIADTH